jgi:uncharacterized protein
MATQNDRGKVTLNLQFFEFQLNEEQPMNQTDKDEITRLTEGYGGVWGINHTRRLLNLVALVGAGQKYDSEVVWLAAHLHDWGAYAPWAQEGVDHAVRSTQVAEEFLSRKDYPDEFQAAVLECIATHHSSQSDMRLEAILLRDADVLDFLGVVGVLRDFSKNPRNLRKGFETSKKRRDKLPQVLFFESAKQIAAERVRQMDELLASFEADSFGCF